MIKANDTFKVTTILWQNKAKMTKMKLRQCHNLAICHKTSTESFRNINLRKFKILKKSRKKLKGLKHIPL